jgi:hypothetical protein
MTVMITPARFFGAVRSTTIMKKSEGVRGRNEVFEDINKRTNAYVNPPAYTDQVCGRLVHHSSKVTEREIGHTHLG